MYNLIQENANFLVVDKLAGIGFHDEKTKVGEKMPGLATLLKSEFGDIYPVHRLDKITSGLLLFAKNLRTCQEFNLLFSKREIEKYYLAISSRKPKKKCGKIRGDMQRSRRGTWKLLRTSENPAITEFYSRPLEEGRRLFLLRPYTGKTHQIRVAMKSLGSPIAGDGRYSDSSISPQCERAYLHAYCLRFQLAGQLYQFKARPETGEYFVDESCQQSILTHFNQPWELTWKGAR